MTGMHIFVLKCLYTAKDSYSVYSEEVFQFVTNDLITYV